MSVKNIHRLVPYSGNAGVYSVVKKGKVFSIHARCGPEGG